MASRILLTPARCALALALGIALMSASPVGRAQPAAGAGNGPTSGPTGGPGLGAGAGAGAGPDVSPVAPTYPVMPPAPLAAPGGSGPGSGPTAGAPSAPPTGSAGGGAPVLALPENRAAGRPGRQEPVTLNFANADIEAVARTMATITGRSIVVDPRVRGTLNLATDRPVSPQAAYAQFLATLRLAGYTVVDAAGLLKVVPEAEARLQGGPVVVERPAGGNAMATQIFRLQHESATQLVPILRPLISPNNTINVSPGTNALVITDYADNLQRLGRIIAALDVSATTDLEVVPLRHTVAADLAPVVQRLAEAGGGGPTVGPAASGLDAAGRVVVVAEPRTNALIIRAPNAARLNLARSLVARLDQPSAQAAGGNIHVVYLKNAEATRLAVTLRAAMASLAPPAAAAGGGPGAGAAAAQAISTGSPASLPAAAGGGGTGGSAASAAVQPLAPPTTGGQIQADPATNALIITAPDPLYRQLRAVIDQLDTRRAQVFVESLIAEVNADKAAELGIQWQHVLGSAGDRTLGVLGTNFTVGGSNLFSLNAGAAQTPPNVVPPVGGTLGIVRNINGTYVLAGLARFLETQADGNVLSTPNLLTLDNEEAKIVIGQNVPFVTGQYTNNNTGGGAVNPFQTIERRDVGLTLRVRPQISESGTVKLQIFQEVSSVQAGSISSPTGPVTNKRSIESNVLVDDGAIVVLGGLLQDEYAGNGQKVPGIGDIPGLGWLFKSESRNRRKTNLMVFLRPVVVRDAARSDELALDRYDLMRVQQRQAQPVASPLFPINQAPQMPPIPQKTARPVPDASSVGSVPSAPAPAAQPLPPARDRE